MTGVGELLASAVLKEVCGKLCSVAWKQIALQLRFSQDLDGLYGMLTIIQAVLADAERRSVKEGSVLLWLKKLKAVAYDIEDILVDFESDIPPCKPQVQDDIPRERKWSPLSHLVSRFTMARKMKKMKERVQQIKHEMELSNFNFKQDTNSHEEDIIKERRTVADLDGGIVGRVAQKERILGLLLAEDEPLVIPIYGLGGLGKTTLARMVYNDRKTERAFDVRAWIYVSKNFDIGTIGKCVISQLDGQSCCIDADLQSVYNHVEAILTGKRFIIVLDDIWEKNQKLLVAIKSLLKGGKTGSKVIITTRSKKIAKIMNTELQIELDPLPDTDCWTLFKNIALEPETAGTCFEEIGKEIADKCKGVPLAVKSLASVLRGKELIVWKAVRDSSIWVEDTTSSDENQVLPSLRLSYYYMPFHLRLCFAYCSVIPKGSNIEKSSLIQQWLALGLVQSTHEGLKAEDCAELCFSELLEMSFFHPSSTPSSIAARHSMPSAPREFTMHDMVHALATFVAGDEVTIFNVPEKRKYRFEMDYCRYALVATTIEPSTLQRNMPGKARALHFNDLNLKKLPKHIFTLSKFLRVLDLSGCSLAEFPSSISKLRQLKYLYAKGMQIRELPKSIGVLQNLQALTLIDCHSLVKLPSYFSDFLRLHYLDLHGCSSLEELPENIGNLTGLLYLDLSKCHSLQVLPSTFEQLKNLSFLNLSKCSNLQILPESFGKLVNLEDLNLSFCHKLGFIPAPNHVLRFLDLSGCANLESLPEFDIGHKSLEILNLTGCNKLEALPDSVCHLTALKSLDLSNCIRLRQLPPLSEHYGLQFLNLSGCSALDYITGFLARSTLKNLEYLNLSGVELNISQTQTATISRIPDSNPGQGSSGSEIQIMLNKLIEGMAGLKYLSVAGYTLFSEQRIASMEGLLSLPEFHVVEMVHPMEGYRCSNIILLHQILDLTHSHLSIRGLMNITSPEDASKARLAEKHQLRSLNLVWAAQTIQEHAATATSEFLSLAEREDELQLGDDGLLSAPAVLEELRPPQKIEKLCMEGYIGATFPNWLMSIASELPHIVHLQLSRLPLLGCTSLPPIGQLPNLEVLELSLIDGITKVGLDVYGGTSPFPKLREFVLNGMSRLEEWMTDEVVFPNLQHLVVTGCHSLTFKPSIPMCCRYTIRASESVLSFKGAPVSPPGSSTSIMYIEGFYSEWSGLEYLINMEELSIHDCGELTTLPESIRRLQRLQRLYINKCSKFTSLPEWFGDLINLKELVICGCKPLESLPVSMTRLCHLQKLDIDVKHYSLPEWLGDLASLWELRLKTFDLPSAGEHLKTWGISTFCTAMKSWFKDVTKIMNHISYVSIDEKELFLVHSPRSQSGGCCSNIVLLQQITRLEHGNLSIFNLENVHSPEEAAEAGIATTSNLRALRLTWSVSAVCAVEGPETVQDEAVLSNLEPPRDLLVLIIEGYRGASFSGWMMNTCTLPCILEVTLSSLSWCKHLPPLGLLPNLQKLHISDMPRLTKVTSQPFAKLRYLVVFRASSLEEWSTVMSVDAVLPRLQVLQIESCPKLRFSPSFPRSTKYFIQNSCKVLSFQQVIEAEMSPASSSKMEIQNCQFSSVDDLRGFQYLSNLEELTISNCNTLTSLPESTTGLHSLRKLHVLQCRKFCTLPECFEHLSSLQDIRIDPTIKLVSLPESIQRMAALVSLTFWCDVELETRYQSGGMDNDKIAHIRDVKINGRYVRPHRRS